MKHMRKILVAFFLTLVPKMEDEKDNLSEALTIRGMCSEFKKAYPHEECPSDMQIRMAADDVFKPGGYDGVSKVWITERTWLKEKVVELSKEIDRLNNLMWDKSHAAKVLATKQESN